MSQQEEYQKLARKFVDLWQEQMGAMLKDGEFTRALLAIMQGNAFATKETSYGTSATSTPAGSASTASDARDAALANLAYGLAAIEKRLEGLEDALANVSTHGNAVKRKAPRNMAGTPRQSTSRGSRRKRSAK